MQHQVTWHQKCSYRVTSWALKVSENVFTWASVCISWVAFVTSLIAIRQTSLLFLSECYVKHQYGVFITGEASSEKNKLTKNVRQTNRRRQRKKKLTYARMRKISMHLRRFQQSKVKLKIRCSTFLFFSFPFLIYFWLFQKRTRLLPFSYLPT